MGRRPSPRSLPQSRFSPSSIPGASPSMLIRMRMPSVNRTSIRSVVASTFSGSPAMAPRASSPLADTVYATEMGSPAQAVDSQM